MTKLAAIVAAEVAVAVALVYGIHYVAGDRVTEKTVVITEKKVRVITEKLTVPRPSQVKYATLADPKRACTGAPVVIESVTIAPVAGAKEGEKITWLRVRPAGDEYLVACRQNGAWEEFKKGDLVSLTNGAPG